MTSQSPITQSDTYYIIYLYNPMIYWSEMVHLFNRYTILTFNKVSFPVFTTVIAHFMANNHLTFLIFIKFPVAFNLIWNAKNRRVVGWRVRKTIKRESEIDHDTPRLSCIMLSLHITISHKHEI